jgi:hypothetical protein
VQSPADSPLSQLMGWYDFDEDEGRAQELAIQQAMVECMKDDGWTYLPVDSSQGAVEYAEPEIDPASDPEAYGERYGYGVVLNYELYTVPRLESGVDPGAEFVDPNQEYVEGEEDPNAVVASPPLEEQGCQGKAQPELAVSESE